MEGRDRALLLSCRSCWSLCHLRSRTRGERPGKSCVWLGAQSAALAGQAGAGWWGQALLLAQERGHRCSLVACISESSVSSFLP